MLSLLRGSGFGEGWANQKIPLVNFLHSYKFHQLYEWSRALSDIKVTIGCCNVNISFDQTSSCQSNFNINSRLSALSQNHRANSQTHIRGSHEIQVHCNFPYRIGNWNWNCLNAFWPWFINVVNFSAWATLLLSLMCLIQAQAAPADPPAEEEEGGEDEDAVEDSEGNGRTCSWYLS